MNKQNPGIGWTDYTWNPIKGLCPVGCWYCYARKMYKRFKLNPDLWLDTDELPAPSKLRKPSRIFVCSILELFHPKTGEARDRIFKEIKACPQHTFQILTKMPENINRPMPDNVWLGVTATDEKSLFERGLILKDIKARVKFLSLEPYLSEVRSWGEVTALFDWIIIGRLTGYGKKRDPHKIDMYTATMNAKHWATPIFLKDNLKDIWGEPLIQEFPK